MGLADDLGINTVIRSLIGGGVSLAGLFSGNQQTMAPAQLDPLQPASQPWGTTAPYSLASLGNQNLSLPGQPPQASLYQPSMAGGGPSLMGGGTSSYDPTANPNQIPMPQQPSFYQSALAAASQPLSEALKLRAVRPTTFLSRTYNIPAAQPVTAGATVQQPARRLSPLERYQMMLAGMR